MWPFSPKPKPAAPTLEQVKAYLERITPRQYGITRHIRASKYEAFQLLDGMGECLVEVRQYKDGTMTQIKEAPFVPPQRHLTEYGSNSPSVA